jgi:hypothetical protein
MAAPRTSTAGTLAPAHDLLVATGYGGYAFVAGFLAEPPTVSVSRLRFLSGGGAMIVLELELADMAWASRAARARVRTGPASDVGWYEVERHDWRSETVALREVLKLVEARVA